MMRKLPNFVPNLFETLMLFLMDIEDEQLWHGADNDQHEDEGAGDRFQFGQVRGRGGGQGLQAGAGAQRLCGEDR